VAAGSPALDHGPPPAEFDGEPCTDIDGAPRLQDASGDGLAIVDIGAYEHADPAAAPLVPDLRWTDRQTLVWSAVTGALEYHVYRGALPALGYSYFGECIDGSDPDRTDTMFVGSEAPTPGSAWFFFVTVEDGASQAVEHLGAATCAERSNFFACP
jgi:hypothetical protein